MKTKIIGILVCMLLIATALAASAVGIINSKAQPEMLQGVLDQSQERSDECIWFEDAWQEFVPVGKNLLHVEVKIKQGYESSPDLIMYIEDSLGSPLVSLNMKATDIPDVCDWVIFDIDDVELVPGDTYIIHLKYDPGGEYAWCGANGDPYPAGDSDIGAQWDWCFRTYVDKSKTSIDPIPTTTGTADADVSLATPVSQQSLILQFLERLAERFPNAFPILRHLLGL